MKKTFLFKLLATKKLIFEDGKISLGITDYNLLPTIFISSLTEYFHSRNDMNKLYLISWFWGFECVKYANKTLGLDSQEEIYSVGMDLAASMGMGVYDTNNYYPGRYTKFKIKENPYLKDLKLEKFEKPVDIFTAGAMAGGGSLVHKEVCQNIELKCKALGASDCEFITATRKEFEKRDMWKEVDERYSVTQFIEFQKEVFNSYNRENSGEFVEKLSDLLREL